MFFIFSDNDLQIQVAKVFNNTDYFIFLKEKPYYGGIVRVRVAGSVQKLKYLLLLIVSPA